MEFAMWHRPVSLVVVALALSTGSFSSPALAQMACGKRGDFLALLAKQYGETPTVIGITDRGALLDVVVSSAGTWTMMITVAGGPTCIVATGRHWEMLPATAEKPGV
jgi:hypothetical protein